MKYYLLALLAGVIFPLGFAPFNIWPLVILSLSWLLYLLRNEETKRAFFLGFIYGIGMWGLGVSWVYVSIHYHGNIGIIYSLLITFAFIVFLSLYIGLITFLFQYLKTTNKTLNYLVFFPVIWVSIELLRSYFLTGFPWLIIGTSLAGTSFGGWIPVLGSYGGSVFVLMMSGCLSLIYEKSIKNNVYPVYIIIIILISSFSLNKINWTSEIGKINASIYQPNLTLQKKWSTQGILLTTNLIQTAVENAQNNEFIFFPETALILERQEIEPWISIIETKAKEKNISLITGIIARDFKEEALIERFNRVQGFGSIKGKYDKHQLVPFGEYIPLRSITGKILDIMDLNLVNTLPGKDFTKLISKKVIISPSICYEVAFNDLVRKTAKSSNLLVTISNDTWFGESFGPAQHLEIAQTRALEHQKSLIRATNSGISAIISKNGEIIKKQGLFESKTLKGKVKLYEGSTLFSITGNYLLVVYIMIVMMYLFYYNRTNVTLISKNYVK